MSNIDSYIFLLTITVIFLVLFLCWVFIRREGYDIVIKRKIDEYRFKKVGKYDLDTIKAKLSSLGIKTEETNIEDKVFFEHCVRELEHYYKKAVLPSEFQTIIELNQTFIAYSHQEVLILPEEYNITEFFIEYSFDGISYKYYDSKYKEHYFSINQLLKKLDSLAAIVDSKSIRIPLDNFFWQVGGLTSSAYKLASVATDALAGGVLFGAAGAFIGASKAADKANKEDNRYGIIGECGGKSWKVAESYQVDWFIKDMNKHFPDNRAVDLYRR